MATRYFPRSVVYNGRIYAAGMQTVPDDMPMQVNGRDLGTPTSPAYADMPLSALIAEAHGRGMTVEGSGPDGAITRNDVIQVLGRGGAATPPPEPGGPPVTPAQVGLAPQVPPTVQTAETAPAAPPPAPAPVAPTAPAQPAQPAQPNVQPPPAPAAPAPTAPDEGGVANPAPGELPSRSWNRDPLLAEAQRRGITVTGTGQNGYITKDDVVRALGL